MGGRQTAAHEGLTRDYDDMEDVAIGGNIDSLDRISCNRAGSNGIAISIILVNRLTAERMAEIPSRMASLSGDAQWP